MEASATWGSAGFDTWSFIFLFFILTLFLKLYKTNLILFCSQMTRVLLLLQILIPWHLGVILMKSLRK